MSTSRTAVSGGKTPATAASRSGQSQPPKKVKANCVPCSLARQSSITCLYQVPAPLTQWVQKKWKKDGHRKTFRQKRQRSSHRMSQRVGPLVTINARPSTTGTAPNEPSTSQVQVVVYPQANTTR